MDAFPRIHTTIRRNLTFATPVISFKIGNLEFMDDPTPPQSTPLCHERPGEAVEGWSGEGGDL